MYHILYVDDEPDLLEIAKIYLEDSKEFTIDISTSADEMLKSGTLQQYDAIISDYQMPGTDGIAFLKQVRSRFGTIPFILFTGRGREEIIIQALNEGADFYLQKGGDPKSQFAELVHKMRIAIQKRHLEERVGNQERREGDILNFLPDPTFAINTHGIVIAWNRAMEQLTGVTATEILGKGNYEYAIPIYGERRPVLIDLVFTPIEEIRKKYSFVRSDGQGFTAEAPEAFPRGKHAALWEKAVPLHDIHGTVVGAIESLRDITLRKHEENALKESRKFMESIIDFLPDATFAINNDKRVIVWNRAMEKMTGILKENMICQGNHTYTIPFFGTPREQLLDLIDTNNAELESRYQNFQRDGNTLYAEIFSPALYGKKGAYIWVTGAPLFNAAGNRTGAIESIRDITEIKRTNEELQASVAQITATEEVIRQNLDEFTRGHEALQKSEEKYRRIVDTANEGIWAVDSNLRITFVNQRMADILGYSKEDMIGMSVASFRLPEELSDHLELIRQRQQGKIGKYERRFCCKDGSIVWAMVSATPIFTNNGNFDGSFAMFTDITKRKRAEEALWLSNTYNRTLLETCLDPLVTIDKDGKISDVNKATEQATGFSRESLIGTNFSVCFTEPDAAWKGYQTAFECGAVHNYPLELRHRDGSTRSVLYNASVYRDANGSITGVFAVARDITDSKRAEEALRQANRQLNLLNSVTRHDINNKITVILGYLSLGKTEAKHPKMANYISKLESATMAILAQIEFTRTYQDLGTHEPQWQDLMKILPYTHVPAHVTLQADVSGIEIFADPMLEKVFYNLLDNSLRHGERVTKITVSSRQSDSGLTLLWEDNGVGIAADVKERIFERGFGKNTGFGLFLVREILSLSGMSIAETGTFGNGARFEIVVPKGAWRLREN